MARCIKIHLDISGALKLLAEKECLPMFLATSDMVKETPIMISSSDENDSHKEMKSRLNEIEKSVKTINKNIGTLSQTPQRVVNGKEITQDSARKPEEPDSIHIATRSPWADHHDIIIDTNSLQKEEGWKTVPPYRNSKPNTNKKPSWKDKLNILKGTAIGDNDEVPPSADVHLVAYGLGKDSSGDQLSRWLKSNG